MAFQKAVSKENISYFQVKIEKNGNSSKELRKTIKSLGIKSCKVNQLKTAFKRDGAIQFELTKKCQYF